jgi:hypothetical protein
MTVICERYDKCEMKGCTHILPHKPMDHCINVCIHLGVKNESSCKVFLYVNELCNFLLDISKENCGIMIRGE